MSSTKVIWSAYVPLGCIWRVVVEEGKESVNVSDPFKTDSKVEIPLY